jgi:heme A synthase
MLLGALNVWLGEHPGLIIAHLALGTVLWWTVVYAGSSLLPATSPAGERLARGRRTARTVEA